MSKDFEGFFEAIGNIGIVPVIKLDNYLDARDLAQALNEGGIPCAEVTFRAEGADKAISAMKKAYPHMIVGAGTVTTCEQVDRAIDAGASFCVAPGLNLKVATHCIKKGVPFMPGVSGCSEIESALEAGISNLKFFPAEQAGGLDYIKAVCAPYTSVRFMPTGGVNEGNINSYLSYDKIIACGGSWMASSALINSKNWSEITRVCKNAVDKILGFELAHVGVNCQNSIDSEKNADILQTMFGWQKKVGNSSDFASSFVEFSKTSTAKGANGHLAIKTNSIKRAIFHLKQRGFEVDEQSIRRDEKGNIKAVYLVQEVGGFALHLI